MRNEKPYHVQPPPEFLPPKVRKELENAKASLTKRVAKQTATRVYTKRLRALIDTHGLIDPKATGLARWLVEHPWTNNYLLGKRTVPQWFKHELDLENGEIRIVPVNVAAQVVTQVIDELRQSEEQTRVIPKYVLKGRKDLDEQLSAYAAAEFPRLIDPEMWKKDADSVAEDYGDQRHVPSDAKELAAKIANADGFVKRMDRLLEPQFRDLPTDEKGLGILLRDHYLLKHPFTGNYYLVPKLSVTKTRSAKLLEFALRGARLTAKKVGGLLQRVKKRTPPVV